MNRGKILFGFLLIGLIIGAVVGISYLFLFVFVSVYNGFTDIMLYKGASNDIAPIVALILTVFIFFSISRNQTVNNYISGKMSKWTEDIF